MSGNSEQHIAQLEALNAELIEALKEWPSPGMDGGANAWNKLVDKRSEWAQRALGAESKLEEMAQIAEDSAHTHDDPAGETCLLCCACRVAALLEVKS